MLQPAAIFWIVFGVLLVLIILLDRKYYLLRDESSARTRPYSYARTQLAWWTLIVLSFFIAILITKGSLPELYNSTVILLGISAATTVVSRVLDVSDAQNLPAASLSRNQESDSFLLDLLSDNNGVTVHRLQAVIFNLVIGAWFIACGLKGLQTCQPPSCCIDNSCVNTIMPDVGNNILVLLGISSGTYAGLKSAENKTQTPPPANTSGAPAASET